MRRVLVIDDHQLFAQGLSLLISRDLGFQVVMETRCEAALARLRGDADFALIVLDLELPGVSGIEGLYRLREVAPHIPVVVVSGHTATLARDTALERGARAFIAKSEAPENLIAALRRTLDTLCLPQLSSELPAPRNASGLTARQQEVLLLMSEGQSNKMIARCLAMSENTVRNHVSAILERLGVTNRHEAAAAARRLGLLDENRA